MDEYELGNNLPRMRLNVLHPEGANESERMTKMKWGVLDSSTWTMLMMNSVPATNQTHLQNMLHNHTQNKGGGGRE